MGNIRWMKPARDLWLGRGRAALMVIAIAAGNTGVGAILISHSIVSREMSGNYLGTHPASATLKIDAVDDALVEQVRARPGIAGAEARSSLLARVQIGPDQWRPLLLFVVEDFDAMRVSTVRPVEGAWPPPMGTMLVERSAIGMLGARPGEHVVVKAPNGERREVGVSGVVHDPSLAPAWQQRSVYGYITRDTLRYLGESGTLDELKILVDDPSANADAIERTARDLASWIQAQGHTVEEIQVPPPRKHPHQSQMMAAMLLLMLFAGLALMLGSILVATMVGGMMAEQIRQIGVMKAIGAQTRQIAGLYLIYVLAISLAAWVLAVPASVALGYAFAAEVAELMNLELASRAIPGWVFGIQAAAGLLVPLWMAMGPILRGSRVTVREALDDYGVSAAATGHGVDAWLTRLHGLDRTSSMALRNALRRRRRLTLNIVLLAAGGATFMAGLNVAAVWMRNVDEALGTNHYDVEVQLSAPAPSAPLVDRIRAVPGVATVEAWEYVPIAVYHPREVDVVMTYPDRGHGSLSLRGAPVSSTLVDFPLVAGRWLQAGDTDAVVLNTSASWQIPDDTGIGDSVTFSSEGRQSTWRIVGIVREPASPGTAYVTDEALARSLGEVGMTRSLRIVSARGDDDAHAGVVRGVERALEESGANVSLVLSSSELRAALGDHIKVLIVALLSMATLLAIVGAIGLAATISAGIVERTRELGVLRTIGATPGTIVRMVVTEGLVVGILSWFAAIAGAIPLSIGVGLHIGVFSLRAPLPWEMPIQGPLIWLAIVVVLSILASAVPALRASRLTVREALTHT